MRSSTLLVVVSTLTILVCVSAFAPPPVFEHKADRNFKGTNCEVSDVVEGLCAVESFGRYEYSPPTMVSACNDFLSNNGEDLEEILFKGVMEDRKIRTKLCIDTGICDKLWTAEAEELKRDRSPEESKQEQQEQQRKAKEEEKKKKAEEKAAKAEKAKKKKEEAAAKKAAEEAGKATETPAAEATPVKEEL